MSGRSYEYERVTDTDVEALRSTVEAELVETQPLLDCHSHVDPPSSLLLLGKERHRDPQNMDYNSLRTSGATKQLPRPNYGSGSVGSVSGDTSQNNQYRYSSKLNYNPKAPSYSTLATLCLCVITSDACRGLLFPTLWWNIGRLGGSITALGQVVAVLNAGKMLGAPLQGCLAGRWGSRAVLIYSSVLMAMGAALYTYATTYASSCRDGSWAICMIMISHGLLGIGAGNLGIIRSCVMGFSSGLESSTNMAYLASLQYVSYIALPLIGSLLPVLISSDDEEQGSNLKPNRKLDLNPSQANFAFESPTNFSLGCIATEFHLDGIADSDPAHHFFLNKSNIAGFSLLLMSIVTVFFSFTCMTLMESTAVAVSRSKSQHKSRTSIFSGPIALCCVLNFIIKGTVGVFETFALTFAVSKYSWTGQLSGVVFAVCGVVGLLFLSLFSTLARRFDDIAIILGGMVLMATSLNFLVFDSLYNTKLLEHAPGQLSLRDICLYAAFVMMLGCGYPLAHTSLLGALSKQIKDRENPSISRSSNSSGGMNSTGNGICKINSNNISISSINRSSDINSNSNSNININNITSNISALDTDDNSATVNGWFVFFGALAKFLFPLLGGEVMRSKEGGGEGGITDEAREVGVAYGYSLVFVVCLGLLLSSVVVVGTNRHWFSDKRNP